MKKLIILALLMLPEMSLAQSQSDAALVSEFNECLSHKLPRRMEIAWEPGWEKCTDVVQKYNRVFNESRAQKEARERIEANSDVGK